MIKIISLIEALNIIQQSRISEDSKKVLINFLIEVKKTISEVEFEETFQKVKTYIEKEEKKLN